MMHMSTQATKRRRSINSASKAAAAITMPRIPLALRPHPTASDARLSIPAILPPMKTPQILPRNATTVISVTSQKSNPSTKSAASAIETKNTGVKTA